MSRTEQERLTDIREAMRIARSHLERQSGDTDETLLHDALLYQLVVIGEAVKNLSLETRELQPDIPWNAVAGLRDLIAHEYFRIDVERILEIVDKDFPPLEAAVDRLLAA